MMPPVSCVLKSAIWKIEDMTKAEDDQVKAFDLSRLRQVLTIVERDWDGSAANPIADMDELLALLRRGAEISPPPLAVVLRRATEMAPPHLDLRISALEDKLDNLLSALIEMQTWLEVAQMEAAKRLLSDVWAFLERRTRRNAVMDSIW